MKINNGIDVVPKYDPLGFIYGEGVFGPKVENRRLDDIRKSLLDPDCKGPDIVYSMAMDVGKQKDKSILLRKNLLFGVVTYASGRLGREPVRSQGHVHAISKSCNSSTPEIYEIWTGEAIIYMQESTEDNPGRCFAVHARHSEIVIVPPYWAHCTISANQEEPLTFGALCVRDYGFEYDGVRRHNGLAWFPILGDNGKIEWIKNEKYIECSLITKNARDYNEFSIKRGTPIYTQFEENPDRFEFVSNPSAAQNLWNEFIP